MRRRLGAWTAGACVVFLSILVVPVATAPYAGTDAARTTFHSYDVTDSDADASATAGALGGAPQQDDALGRTGALRPDSSQIALVVAAEAELPAGYSSFGAAKNAMGSPGAGNVFDHVVEQSQIGRSGFSPEEIYSPFNMNPVSAGTNQLKANYYSTKQFFTGGGTVRDWLNGQSFADQYEFGMDVLRRIENGLPLP